MVILAIDVPKALAVLSRMVSQQMEILSMNQEQFAAFTKLSQGTISKLESKDYIGMPKISILEAIAKSQGKKCWELIKELEEASPQDDCPLTEAEIIFAISSIEDPDKSFEIAIAAMLRTDKLRRRETINH